MATGIAIAVAELPGQFDEKDAVHSGGGVAGATIAPIREASGCATGLDTVTGTTGFAVGMVTGAGMPGPGATPGSMVLREGALVPDIPCGDSTLLAAERLGVSIATRSGADLACATTASARTTAVGMLGDNVAVPSMVAIRTRISSPGRSARGNGRIALSAIWIALQRNSFTDASRSWWRPDAWGKDLRLAPGGGRGAGVGK